MGGDGGIIGCLRVLPLPSAGREITDIMSHSEFVITTPSLNRVSLNSIVVFHPADVAERNGHSHFLLMSNDPE